MPQPEGYRKAKRLMQLAEQFDMPVITFIDTAEHIQVLREKKEVKAKQLQEI